MRILDNVVKCGYCGAYIEYSPSDIETVERGYGVQTYAGETYTASVIRCPKCGHIIELL